MILKYMSHIKELLGVGIRGAGQVAYEHARAINNNPNLYIAAVCSRTEERARKLAEEFEPGAKVYKHYEELLSDQDIDIVSICMPNFLHVVEAINSGAVHHHPFQQEIDNLTENILHNEPVLSDVPDACKSIEIVLAIEESAAIGKPVKIRMH